MPCTLGTVADLDEVHGTAFGIDALPIPIFDSVARPNGPLLAGAALAMVSQFDIGVLAGARDAAEGSAADGTGPGRCRPRKR